MAMRKPNGESGSNFSSDQLETALRDWEDMAERCLVPWMPGGNTARCIVDNKPLKGRGIYIITEKKHWTKEARSTLETFLKSRLKLLDGEFRYEVEDVPVVVKVVERKYRFFKFKDTVIYNYTEYKVPNPFENYWKARGLVR